MAVFDDLVPRRTREITIQTLFEEVYEAHPEAATPLKKPLAVWFVRLYGNTATIDNPVIREILQRFPEFAIEVVGAFAEDMKMVEAEV